MEYCPISGEPLLDPGQTISHTTAKRLATQTRGLPQLMASITTALGARNAGSEGYRGVRPTSCPPLNLALLDRVDTHRDTINDWAHRLTHHVNPALTLRTADWATIEAIYAQYAPKAATWEHAPTMARDVLDALEAIDWALTPPDTRRLNETEKKYAAGALLDRHLTITPARDAVRLLTGTLIPASTIRTWKHRGKVATIGDPPRYLIRDLINQLDAA